MPNSIQTATIFQQQLDEAAIQLATSGWMELNENLVKYNGGREVKIPRLSTDGLGNYDRNIGFVDGSVTFDYQTETLTMDRGRRFTFDENDVDETAFILTAARVMGTFQREKVVPEIDAYRYSKIATKAIAKSKASGGYVPAESDILKKLYADINAVQDAVGDDTPLMIVMSTAVAGILDMSSEIAKSLSVVDFAQGGINLKVKALNGMHPIIRVSSNRLKTAYVFNDGKTAGQTVGGIVPAAGAKDINWLIIAKNAPIAVSKTDKMRIFSPEEYQTKRSWAVDYRKFHDIWIPDNKCDLIRANIKQAL